MKIKLPDLNKEFETNFIIKQLLSLKLGNNS
jgi:hypothetical protein